MAHIQVEVSPALLEELERRAEKAGATVDDVIRRALRMYLIDQIERLTDGRA